MTTWRRDEHSSPFGLWLRKQNEIDSKIGFITTDIDYIWKNYITNEWMLLEEKRYGKIPTRPQLNCLLQMDLYLKASKLYRGCYVVVFENSTPMDGGIKIGRVDNVYSINIKDIDKDMFLSFLRFEHYV
jgi:hypothetical protein